jgi:hypothetical protein
VLPTVWQKAKKEALGRFSKPKCSGKSLLVLL